MYSPVFPMFALFPHVIPCFSPILAVFPCFSTFPPVFPCFSMFLLDSPCFTVFFYVFLIFPCFAIFFLDSPCFSMFSYVFTCFPVFPPFFFYLFRFVFVSTRVFKVRIVPDNGRGTKISEQEKRLLEISTDFSGLFRDWFHLIFLNDIPCHFSEDSNSSLTRVRSLTNSIPLRNPRVRILLF